MRKIRVKATPDARCAFINDAGLVVPGRFYGIDRDGNTMPNGEVVSYHPQIGRYLARGSLAEAAEPSGKPDKTTA